MLIETQPTPNPQVMKFLPNAPVMGEAAPVEFERADKASSSPLAAALWGVEGVEAVFFGRDFIAIRKRDDGPEWGQIKAELLGVMVDHFTAQTPLFTENSPQASPAGTASAPNGNMDDTEKEIRRLLDLYVRPALAGDGGDVLFQSYEEGVLYLRLRGACVGCPSATMTMKQGIENLLRHYLPQLREVRAVEL